MERVGTLVGRREGVGAHDPIELRDMYVLVWQVLDSIGTHLRCLL